ncbi:aminoacetone oxidase family FAD-binding enzyme [Dechloromonas sp. TW-R-39-2]|uniref:NAD(P)/FAD-dependent oxidoreductase n=1 Tax=Dechloromonas sp. TW-R-39-2 TaxID=2654218 RepID=UPI00193D7A21|nr:NAD(P)/FAD-dependent oxidoreductase [Dechloromonas sp. TW-R-39-2]QRM20118.1 aminoacetone oxidase family FAD-binding enzyme [Dechloromonas sp. TW-R-39-2]
MHFDVIIIGSGAAGMMCAAQAGARGRRVLLVDHAAKIGERIRISGGGRCNFTNRTVSADNYLSQNPHFCRSALARFSQYDFIAMIEKRRIPYHEREHGQLFCDDSAVEIIDMLRDACDAVQVRWVLDCAVHGVEHHPDVEHKRYTLRTASGTFSCQSLVVATGGLAIPQIGASPFGYKLAEQFGIPVVAPKPALVPLALGPELLAPLKPMAGATLDATACFEDAAFRENVLITHRGLSGPAILQVSSYWQMQEYGGGKKLPVEINLLPGLDAAAWLAEHRQGRIHLPNLLAEHLPRRFAQEWCLLQGGEKFQTRPISELSKRDLDAVARTLNAWPLMPSGTLGFAKAEVTLGGVSTAALSSKTMEAKAAPGLYFIGEVVDVTGWLGGYNFQWAWSSGWVAGQFA